MMNTEPHPNVLHVVVRGRVQGVGFRVFVRQSALRHGCRGWVRNLPTGEVEVHAEGDEGMLVELLTDMAQGPPWSHVADLEVQWQHTESAEFDDFRIRR
jgi:acylphosphatase